MKKRILSLCLVLCMVLTMLPTGVLAAEVNRSPSAAVSALATQYGEENAQQMFDTMVSMGLIDRNGNPKTYKIVMDGKTYTLDEMRPFVAEGADLTKIVTVDKDNVDLAFIKKLLAFQEEMTYLDDFFSRQTKELTDEQQVALATMVSQFASQGVDLSSFDQQKPYYPELGTDTNVNVSGHYNAELNCMEWGALAISKSPNQPDITFDYSFVLSGLRGMVDLEPRTDLPAGVQQTTSLTGTVTIPAGSYVDGRSVQNFTLYLKPQSRWEEIATTENIYRRWSGEAWGVIRCTNLTNALFYGNDSDLTKTKSSFNATISISNNPFTEYTKRNVEFFKKRPAGEFYSQACDSFVAARNGSLYNGVNAFGQLIPPVQETYEKDQKKRAPLWRLIPKDENGKSYYELWIRLPQTAGFTTNPNAMRLRSMHITNLMLDRGMLGLTISHYSPTFANVSNPRGALVVMSEVMTKENPNTLTFSGLANSDSTRTVEIMPRPSEIDLTPIKSGEVMKIMPSLVNSLGSSTTTMDRTIPDTWMALYFYVRAEADGSFPPSLFEEFCFTGWDDYTTGANVIDIQASNTNPEPGETIYLDYTYDAPVAATPLTFQYNGANVLLKPVSDPYPLRAYTGRTVAYSYTLPDKVGLPPFEVQGVGSVPGNRNLATIPSMDRGPYPQKESPGIPAESFDTNQRFPGLNEAFAKVSPFKKEQSIRNADFLSSIVIKNSKGDEVTSTLGEELTVEVPLYQNPADAGNNQTVSEKQNSWLTGNTEVVDGKFYVKDLYASIDGGKTKIPLEITDKADKLTGKFTLPRNQGASKYVKVILYVNKGSQAEPNFRALYEFGYVKTIVLTDVIKVDPLGIYFTEPKYPDSARPRTLILGESTALKLKYNFYSSLFVAAATYQAPEDFAWESSNEAVLKVLEDGTLIPVATGSADISIIATNGTTTRDAYTIKPLGKFNVVASDKNTLSVPNYVINKGDKLDLTISANVVDSKYYTGTEVNIYKGIYTGSTPVYTNTVTDPTITTFNIPADLLTNASITFDPSYTIVVKFLGLDITVRSTILVKNPPATVKLSRPSNYFILDTAGSHNITWDIVATPEQTVGTLNVYKNDILLFENIDLTKTTSLSVPVEKLPSNQLRDVYTVNASIKNKPSVQTNIPEAQGYDSYIFYVYNTEALQIAVDGKNAGTELLMDNATNPLNGSSKNITQMKQAEIIALARKIHLTDDLSINFKEFAYGQVSDQILWKNESASVAAMNYIRGGASRQLADYDTTYTKEDGTSYTETVSYAPNVVFPLTGLNDGKTTISATHKFAQITDTLGVTVKTLKNRLYLFQVQPKVSTTASFVNGNGQSKTVTSDSKGAFAIYDASGIASDIHFKSALSGSTYLGTLYNHTLTSGERDETKGELYPINNFELRKAAEVKFNFQVPAFDGYKNNGGAMKPFIGQVTLRGGVYKNGNYCEKPELSGNKTVTLNLQANANGMYTHQFDVTQFWSAAAGEKSTTALKATDELEYIFEAKYVWKGVGDAETDLVDREQGKRYLPAVLKFSGNYSYQDAMKMGTAATNICAASAINFTSSDASTPFVMKMETNRFKPSGNLDNVTFSRGSVGITKQTPRIDLTTTVLWWGDEANTAWEGLKLTMINERKLAIDEQTSKTFKYPFSTIPVSESLISITDKNFWVKNDGSGQAGTLISRLDGPTGTMIKSITAPFAMQNMMWANDISNTGELNEVFKNELISSVFAESSVPVNDKLIGNALKFAGGINFSASGKIGGEDGDDEDAQDGNFTMLISPTADPTKFDALIQLTMGEDLSEMGLPESEDGFASVLFDEAANEYESLLTTAANNTNKYIHEIKDMAEDLVDTGKDKVEFKYQVTGLLKAQIVYDFEKKEWTVQPVGGGIDLGMGLAFSTSIPLELAPIPIQVGFVDIDMGANVGLSYRMHMLTSPVSVDYSGNVLTSDAAKRPNSGNSVGNNASSGATVDYDWNDKGSNFVVDNMTTLKLSAFIEVFGGLGFDYTVVALKIGPFGGVGLKNENVFLNRNYLDEDIANADAPYRKTSFLKDLPGGQRNGDIVTGKQTEKALNASYLNLQGHVGVKFEASLLCISYTKVFASIGFNKVWTYRNWDKIAEYWEASTGEALVYSNAIGQQNRMQKAALAYAEQTGEMAVYDGGAQLQSRKYLEDFAQIWHDDTEPTSKARILDMSAGVPKYILENAYPYSSPKVANDGSFLLYLRDYTDAGNNRVAFSQKTTKGYELGKSIGLGRYNDSSLDMDGNSKFAVATWISLEEKPTFANPKAPTPAEQTKMMNQSEVYFAVYKNNVWDPIRLTRNLSPETNPVVAAGASTALLAWKSVYAPNGENPTDFDGNEILNFAVVDDAAFGRVYGNYNLYNAETSGKIVGFSTAVMDGVDGNPPSYAIAYNVAMKDGSQEIMFAIVDKLGNVKKHTRLTNDAYTDENPQIAVVNFAKTGDPVDWRFVVGWNRNDPKSPDVRLAVFDSNGLLKDDLGDSLYEMSGVSIATPFTFAKMNTAYKTLNNLTVVWPESQSDGKNIGSDKLTAMRFIKDDKEVYTSAAMPMASLPQENYLYTIFDNADTYISSKTQVKSIILGTAYNSGTSEYIEVDAIDPETGADTKERIPVPKSQSNIYSATQTFSNHAEITDVAFNPAEIRNGFDLPVSFTIKNTGIGVMQSTNIKLGSQVYPIKIPNLYPGASKSVTLMYTVPNAVVDLAYEGGITTFADTTTAVLSGKGTLKLAVPDVGISKVDVATEQNGVRNVSVSLYNTAPYKLKGSGKTVKVGLFSSSSYDPTYQQCVMTLTESELALLDAGAYTASLSIKLNDFLGKKDGVQNEIPAGGLTFFIKAWVEDGSKEVVEYVPTNNTGSVIFENLQRKNAGKAVSIDVSQGMDNEKTTANLTLSSNLMAEQKNGNVAVNLLDENGSVLETQYLSTDPITLPTEAVMQKRFAFSQMGASVEANYFAMSNSDSDNTLALLELYGVPLTFDEATATYTAVATGEQNSAVLTAVPSNMAAQVSIGGDASAVGIQTKNIDLTGSISVDVIVTPKLGGTPKTYKLSITKAESISSIITQITVSPETSTVQKGTTQSFAAIVAGTDNPAQTVTWAVVGAQTETSIDSNGLLTIAANETATSLTVTAVPTADPTKISSAVVTVAADVVPTVTQVTVSPATATVQKGATESFTATVEGTDNPELTVLWSVTGGKAGTTINNGSLIIAEDETAVSLTITASSTADPSKVATATITIAPDIIPPTVTQVTVSPATATVEKGTTHSFTATVEGINDPLATVTWSVAGGKTGTIINNGSLIIAEDETATSLTITATSTADATKTGTATITIAPDVIPPTVTKVTVSPATATVSRGTTESFTAMVEGANDPVETVTWSVTGGKTGTIINNGSLIIAEDETAASLTITATSTVDSTKTGTATITIAPDVLPPTVTKVTVSPETITVQKGTTASFIATVEGANNPAQTVTWSVTGGKVGTIINNGAFIIAEDETATSLTITATSTADPTKTGSVTVTVATDVVPPTVTKVTVSPATATVSRGTTHSFAAIIEGINDPVETVTWSVTGGKAETIINNGSLIIAADETATSLTITASSTADATKTGTATITIDPDVLPPTVTKVTVSPETANVQKGTTQSFIATVEGTNDPVSTVTWSVSGGNAGTIINNGSLIIAADETATSLTITATSTADPTKTGTATITVTDTLVAKHTLTVTNGRGDGSYEKDAVVSIVADPPENGKIFDQWTTTSGVTFASVTSTTTQITLPATDVMVVATYKDVPVDTSVVTGITLNKPNLSLYSNHTPNTETLLATVAPETANNKAVTWASSNTAVATVTDGIVTAVGNGKVAITATTVDGSFTASCTVAVTTYTDPATLPSVGTLHDLTVVSTENGSITLSTMQSTVGKIITADVRAADGYVVDTVTALADQGNTQTVTKNPDGTYSFEMPDGKVTVSATFKLAEATDEFSYFDVADQAWYSSAVHFVSKQGVMTGIKDSYFDPQGNISQAMVITTLYRQAGSPKVTTEGTQWYSAGLSWAMDAGISDGRNIDESITREQLITMLWRSVGKPAPQKSSSLNAFTDANTISAESKDAMIWGVETGLVVGNQGKLYPAGNATRAETATLFMRLLQQ